MSAFFLFDNIEIHDQEKLVTYAANVQPIVSRYGGVYRTVGGSVKTVEGQWSLTFPVIIEFESVMQAEAWYYSEEYRPWRLLRQSAVTCNGVLIEGVLKT